ncbi:uncharacterized protein JN550_008485 [Neoarthrinium moseri]|uniref:uncharacterized protein n=1 Tax=Neoarthrinium moseri TaxID=1658444 RepID=UPI001FDC8BFB|nr:uncharacterized protein JN550_008485 [Neoarthrinium moseri]KAI1864939.1 hypothetical protein JN550_008485 [Neoarthrinium moseri]
MSIILQPFLDVVGVVFQFLTVKHFRRELSATNLSSQKMKHTVIIGDGFAGVSAAHRFLKNVGKTTTVTYKLTLVSRDSHFYWNIAAPRGIIPGQIPHEQLFQPINAGFSKYGPNTFKFVLSTATVSRGIVSFTEATQQAVHEFQRRVKTARSIGIVGAGPTGVETAGELAFDGPTVLENRPAGVTSTALKQLEALHVDVRVSTKVKNPVSQPDGKFELILSSDDRILPDLYIPTFGVLPNSSFLPSQFPDAKGFIKVDKYFHIKGTGGAFAIGDVSDSEAP